MPLPAPLVIPSIAGADSDETLIRLWLTSKPSLHPCASYARAVANLRTWTAHRPLAALTAAVPPPLTALQSDPLKDHVSADC